MRRPLPAVLAALVVALGVALAPVADADEPTGITIGFYPSSGDRPLPAGPARARFWLSPVDGLSDLHGTWRLTSAPTDDAPALASGETGPIVDPTGPTAFTYTVPAGLADGTYHLHLALEATSAEHGRLTGSQRTTVLVDQTAPTIELRDPPTVVYPVRDDYLDRAVWKVRTAERTNVFLEVRDGAGTVLADIMAPAQAGDWSQVSWSGSDRGRPVPDGSYAVTLTARDRAGNTTTVQRRIRVSGLARRATTYRRTVSAVRSRTGDFVGRCSSLRKRGGALLLASQTRCAGRKDADSVVLTRHGIYVPQAVERRYLSMRVTVHGGPAGRSRRNYLVLGYLRGKEFTNRAVLHEGRRHVGDLVRDPVRHVFDRETRRPYVLWSTGLAAGSRYVVRSFTVEIRYLALVEPGKRRPSVPQQTSVSPRVAASYSA